MVLTYDDIIGLLRLSRNVILREKSFIILKFAKKITIVTITWS